MINDNKDNNNSFRQNQDVNSDINGSASAGIPSTPDGNKRKNGKKLGPNAKRIIVLVVSVLFFLGGGALLLVNYFVGTARYESLSGRDPVATGATDATNDIGEFPGLTLNSNSDDLLNDPYVLNVMLFGEDQAASESSVNGRSDTMILLSIDNRHKKIKMTSFLRDTYVYIPGEYSTKINVAYRLGGAQLAINTVEANYGVRIDRYAVVNFSTFKSVVDILGGIDIELTDEEILYINCQIAQNNQSEYLPAGTSAGVVHLNGQQALWYARNRGGTVNGVTFSGDDWSRTDRQRNFLNTLIDNSRDASLTDLLQIVNSVGPNVRTNLKKSEITTLVVNALTYLSYDVEQMSMPSENRWSYDYNSAGSVILVDDWQGARHDLAKFIYEDSVAD